MSNELEKAKARLTLGRLKLQQQKAHYAPLHPQSHFKGDPAKQSKKLIADMDATIAGMKEYLATLSKTPHH